MSTSAAGRSLIASVREAGAGCPHCAAEVATGDRVVICQACGTVHHEACWGDRGGCGSYACAPARRPEIVSAATEPVLLITQADLGRAIPLRDAGLPHRAAPPGSRTWSPGLAVEAEHRQAQDQPPGDRLAGLRHRGDSSPCSGSITGLVAVVLALFAMSGIRTSRPARGLAGGLRLLAGNPRRGRLGDPPGDGPSRIPSSRPISWNPSRLRTWRRSRSSRRPSSAPCGPTCSSSGASGCRSWAARRSDRE